VQTGLLLAALLSPREPTTDPPSRRLTSRGRDADQLTRH
jgi:hypothetical protein